MYYWIGLYDNICTESVTNINTLKLQECFYREDYRGMTSIPAAARHVCIDATVSQESETG